MELIETGYPILEVQQFAFVAGGDDDVEIEVVESEMAALLINEVRGAAVAVFDRRRSLQDQARDVGTSKTSSAATSTASGSISALTRRIRFSTTVRTVSKSGSSGSSDCFRWIPTGAGRKVSGPPFRL